MSRTPSKSKKSTRATKASKTRAKAKKGPGKGWHGDPVRHKLAKYGISTTLPDGRRLDVSRYIPAAGKRKAFPGSKDRREINEAWVTKGKGDEEGIYYVFGRVGSGKDSFIQTLATTESYDEAIALAYFYDSNPGLPE